MNKKILNFISVIMIILLFVGCDETLTDDYELDTKKETIINFYISNDGLENGSGTIKNPFKTIEKARDAARKFKKNEVRIYFRKGLYSLDKTFKLTSLDSRTKSAPLTFLNYPNEKVIISGSKLIDNYKIIDSNDTIYPLLSEEAKQHTLVSNLKEIGINSLTKPIVSTKQYDLGGNPTYANELFLNDLRINISRYPSVGLLAFHFNEQMIEYSNNKQKDIEKIDLWAKDKNVFTYGKWHYDWADERNQIKIVNIKESNILLSSTLENGHKENSSLDNGIGFYGFNIANSLIKGSYYIDYNHTKLYYWSNKINNKTYLSYLDSIISIKDSSYITIDGLKFVESKRDAINISGGSNITINNCIIKDIGGIGIYVDKTVSTNISNSKFYELGASGININSGDRVSLTSGKSIIKNNEIFNTAKNILYYTAGIKIYGVGTKVLDNHIYNLPHMAIYFNGNNHIIDGNIIHDVVLKANDAGAIYAGKDWSQRGTVIQNNTIYNVMGEGTKKGATAIYLDDLYCGTTIRNNLIHNVYRAILIGGGRDNIIDNNLISNCFSGVHIDSRGTNVYKTDDDAKTHFGFIMRVVPWESDLWKRTYPNLYTIYENNPRLPINNIVKNNIIVSNINSWWKDFTQDSAQYTFLENNLYIVKEAKDISSFNNIDDFKDYLLTL